MPVLPCQNRERLSAGGSIAHLVASKKTADVRPRSGPNETKSPTGKIPDGLFRFNLKNDYTAKLSPQAQVRLALGLLK